MGPPVVSVCALSPGGQRGGGKSPVFGRIYPFFAGGLWGGGGPPPGKPSPFQGVPGGGGGPTGARGKGVGGEGPARGLETGPGGIVLGVGPGPREGFRRGIFGGGGGARVQWGGMGGPVSRYREWGARAPLFPGGPFFPLYPAGFSHAYVGADCFPAQRHSGDDEPARYRSDELPVSGQYPRHVPTPRPTPRRCRAGTSASTEASTSSAGTGCISTSSTASCARLRKIRTSSCRTGTGATRRSALCPCHSASRLTPPIRCISPLPGGLRGLTTGPSASPRPRSMISAPFPTSISKREAPWATASAAGRLRRCNSIARPVTWKINRTTSCTRRSAD